MEKQTKHKTNLSFTLKASGQGTVLTACSAALAECYTQEAEKRGEEEEGEERGEEGRERGDREKEGTGGGRSAQ